MSDSHFDALFTRGTHHALRHGGAERSGLCFHLVLDTTDRLPQTGDKGITLKQQKGALDQETR